MFKKISRSSVCGFLKVDGRKIINGKGEEFLPLGVAFGNWLLCEDNMWAFGEGNYYDRPRRFEALIRERWIVGGSKPPPYRFVENCFEDNSRTNV